ncbi:heme-binding protein [Pseudomonas aestuarii]|uniref:heme-binding protein n=1 Tax=Pseudomonas aestuarii TaxID=3018340 RepID=UPI0038CD5DB8
MSGVAEQPRRFNWAVSVMMRASDSLATLPEPKDPAMTLRQVPARQIALVRYSGFWSEQAYTSKKAELDAWIENTVSALLASQSWPAMPRPLFRLFCDATKC